MKVKTVEIEGKQYAELDSDGRVLYDDGGREFAFDAAQTYGKIQELTSEAQKHREAKEAAEKQARDHKTKLDQIDQGKLVESGELEKARKEIAGQYETQLQEERAAREKLEAEHSRQTLENKFATSKYVKDNLAVPVDMAQRTFGDRFTSENGRMVAKDANGNVIYSRQKAGEPADFDEAMAIIVEAYPYKDSIIKASNQNGTGGDPDDKGGPTRTVTRAQFEQLNPAQQAEVSKEASAGKVSLVD